MKNKSSQRGQTMVEYIIVVVIIAIAAIAVFGVFGDRIRGLVGGASEQLGGAVDPNAGTKSADYVKSIGN